MHLLSGARITQNPADGKEQPPLPGVSSQPAARSARASFGQNSKEPVWFLVPGLGPPSRPGFDGESEPDPGNIGNPLCFYRTHIIPGKIPALSKVFLLPGNIGNPQCFCGRAPGNRHMGKKNRWERTTFFFCAFRISSVLPIHVNYLGNQLFPK